MGNVSLDPFLDRAGSTDRRLVVVGAEADDPLAAMLAETFSTSINVGSIADDDVPESEVLADEPTVVLVEGGEVRATSPMHVVYDAVLGIKSDLFVTGARGIGEVSLPAALAGLDGHRFRLRGYPRADKEKLLLIVVSRWIEGLARERGRAPSDPRSRASRGSTTRSALGRSTRPSRGLTSRSTSTARGGSEELDRLGTVHRGTSAVYRRSWFVVFWPPAEESDTGTAVEESAAGAAPDGAALAAVEDEPGIWEGFWTTDPERVREIDDYIERAL